MEIDKNYIVCIIGLIIIVTFLYLSLSKYEEDKNCYNTFIVGNETVYCRYSSSNGFGASSLRACYNGNDYYNIAFIDTNTERCFNET